MPSRKRIEVKCRSCGLLKKVERREALPPCAKCGGTLVPVDAPLRAELTPPPEPLPNLRFCPACGAKNPAAARSCEACGAPLAERAAGAGDTGSPRR